MKDVLERLPELLDVEPPPELDALVLERSISVLRAEEARQQEAGKTRSLGWPTLHAGERYSELAERILLGSE
jgi:hypothetical protein